MSIKYLMKRANWSPAAMAAAAGLSGLGLGLGYNAYKKYKGLDTSYGTLKAALLGLGLATPAVIHGLTRGNLDKDQYGEHTSSLKDRWFKNDEAFEENPYVQANLDANNALFEQRKYRERDPITKEPIILKKKGSLQKKAWTPIPNSNLNNFNRLNLVSAVTGRTPAQDALFANGLLNNTRQGSPHGLVTPGRIVGNLVNAGIGYGTAYMAGKALGAMAGVSPATQNKLCEMGAWGGMLSGIHNTVNNYNNRFK